MEQEAEDQADSVEERSFFQYLRMTMICLKLSVVIIMMLVGIRAYYLINRKSVAEATLIFFFYIMVLVCLFVYEFTHMLSLLFYTLLMNNLGHILVQAQFVRMTAHVRSASTTKILYSVLGFIGVVDVALLVAGTFDGTTCEPELVYPKFF